MARTKTKGWSYSTGERGRNRVRTFEHPSGLLMLEFSDQGNRTRLSLGHRDHERAKREADEAAAKLANAEDLKPEEPTELTLGALFEMYLGEVTPQKGERSRRYDRVATEMFEHAFGRDRVVSTLNLRDWEAFIRDRSAGRTGPGSPPWSRVAPRTIERDLRFILAVLNWATMAGTGNGAVLLERNPFRGYRLPKEKNPRRVTITDKEYRALLDVAPEIDWRFSVALVLAHETGHRIGAIRELRWSDIDQAGDRIVWRAEHEKNGYEHMTPMTSRTRVILNEARQHHPGIGNSPVLPSPKDASRAVGRYLVRSWWRRAEGLSGLERVPGRGWHSLRRRFATDLMHVPLKVLCQLGGWKTPETVLACYQRPSEDDMRAALDQRRTASETG